MTTDRIVEVYSAADMVEAELVGAALEEAGIMNRIVGDSLGNAAGLLPFGETVAPKIWVHEADADNAREIIAQWNRRPLSEAAENLDNQEVPESDATVEGEEGSPPTDQRFHFFSGIFAIAGLACIVFGAVKAYQNWETLSKYSATIQAQLVDAQDRTRIRYTPPGDPNLPFEQGKLTSRQVLRATYVYTIDETPYFVEIRDSLIAPPQITVRYDPENPSRHLVRAVMSPWMIVVLSSCLGAFLMFMSRQFR